MEKNNKNNKIKLLVSYGGKISHRTHDRKLAYIGGDTKILTVERTVSFANLITKLNNICDNYNSYNEMRIKYKLPGQDLDALVSVFDDDDVENMLYEYDYLKRVLNGSPRLRLFVFVPVTVTTPVTPDFLFGFDKEYSAGGGGYNGIQENTDFLMGSNNVGQEIPVNVTDFSVVTRGNYVYQAPIVCGTPGGYLQAGGQVRGDQEQTVVYCLIGGGNREQPVVYSYLPVMPLEQTNIPYGSVKGEVLQSTVKMAATLDRDSKVVAANETYQLE